MVRSFVLLMTDRWPSFSHFASKKFPKFHQCLKGCWQLTLAHSTINACTSLGRHCNATRHMAAFNLHFAEKENTVVGASDIEKKDRVTPLVPLFPFWSVVIAASKTGMSTKTEVRDGSVLVDQRWLQWSTCSCPGCSVEYGRKISNFNDPAAAKLFKTATDALGLNGMTMYQTRHRRANIYRVHGFRILQSEQKRDQWHHSLPRLETLARHVEGC